MVEEFSKELTSALVISISSGNSSRSHFRSLKKLEARPTDENERTELQLRLRESGEEKEDAPLPMSIVEPLPETSRTLVVDF